MKFNFQLFSVLCLTAIASFQLTNAAFTDMTTDALVYVNEKRTKDLTNKLSTVATDTTMNTALNTYVTKLETDTCVKPTASDASATYGRSWTELDSSTVTAAEALKEFFDQSKNYDCKYPPTENSLIGSVDDYTNIMAESLTHMDCGRNGCTNPVFVCYFKPKFAGDEGTPYKAAVWEELKVRDDVCSGEYFTKYAGLLTSIAAFTIGWSYISS